NFSRPVVVALAALGHDVVTAQSEGLAGRSDQEVLAHATQAGRAVLTHDRDFLRLHRTMRPHVGIVHCTPDFNVAAQAARIDSAVTAAPLPDTLVRVRRPQGP